jgi:hypothetical protein
MSIKIKKNYRISLNSDQIIKERLVTPIKVAAPGKNGESDNQRNILLMEEMKEGTGRIVEIFGTRQCNS